jgi:phage FluMu protein Com
MQATAQQETSVVTDVRCKQCNHVIAQKIISAPLDKYMLSRLSFLLRCERCRHLNIIS